MKGGLEFNMKWNDSIHGVQPGSKFKQVPPEDYYRAMECVNALVGISDPKFFVEEAVKLMEKKEESPLSTLTETDRGNLCDIIWWLRGYKKGAENTFNDCPFHQDHLDTLEKTTTVLREIFNQKK